MNRRDAERDAKIIARMVEPHCSNCGCHLPGRRDPKRLCQGCKEELAAEDRKFRNAANCASYYIRYREELLARSAAYYARNRDAILAKRRARRARLKNSTNGD